MALKSIVKFTTLSAVSSLAILSSNAVSAQSADADSELMFEEIIVTAGRREQTVQDVPAAVSAISPDDFKFKGIKQLNEVLEYTPGVVFTQGGKIGHGNISARGVPQSSATPVFGIYVDDTPMTTNTNFAGGAQVLFDALLLDIERVEVIKGPQGTLYGATSVGGMMRYISREPALDEFRASASVDYSTTKGGSWGQTYSGKASLPLVKDKLGVTLMGFYQEAPGYVDYVNAGTGEVEQENVDGGDVGGYAADLMFVANDKLDVRLKYINQKSDYISSSSVQLTDATGAVPLFGGYTSIATPSPTFLDYELASGTINYDLGWAMLSSTSSYTEYAFGGNQDVTSAFAGFVDLLDGRAPGTTTYVDLENLAGSEKFVQEVRLTAERTNNIEWIAGLYYATEDSFNGQSAQGTPAFDLLTIQFPSSYKEYAVFGDATYYLSDKFDVTAGARLSKIKVQLDYTTTGALLGTADLSLPKNKDTVDTYLFSARYRPTDNMSLYARVASGYRPVQGNLPVLDPFTQENLANPVVASDHAWSYEVGVKGSAADNMLSYELAVWKIDWSNFQSPLSVSGVTVGGNASDGLSAYGMESTLVLRPTADFSVTGNLSYSNSTLNADEPTFGGVEGEHIPNLPKWRASVLWDYSIAVSSDWMARMGGGLRYTGKYMSAYSESSSNAPVEIDSRLLADLNLSVSNDMLTFVLYATNVFNETKLVDRSDIIIAPGLTDSSGIYERPRTIGLSVKVDF